MHSCNRFFPSFLSIKKRGGSFSFRRFISLFFFEIYGGWIEAVSEIILNCFVFPNKIRRNSFVSKLGQFLTSVVSFLMSSIFLNLLNTFFKIVDFGFQQKNDQYRSLISSVPLRNSLRNMVG